MNQATHKALESVSHPVELLAHMHHFSKDLAGSILGNVVNGPCSSLNKELLLESDPKLAVLPHVYSEFTQRNVAKADNQYTKHFVFTDASGSRKLIPPGTRLIWPLADDAGS